MLFSDIMAVTAYFKKYFKDMHNRKLNSAITGLLLIYPSHSVHVVEVRYDRVEHRDNHSAAE